MRKITIHEYEGQRILAVDGEAFDWGLDPKQFEKAKFMIKNDPLMKESVIGNIQRHFVDSFSEFVGKDMTLAQINEAIQEGEIQD